MKGNLNFIQNLCFKGKIKIFIFVIIFAQKSPMMKCLENAAAADIDVLELAKPIQEYVEFESYKENAKVIPDYQFQIVNVSFLVPYKTELRGNKFQLPELNLTAQIKCRVEYDEFKFFIRFLHPENNKKQEGKVERINDELLIITTALVSNYSNLEGGGRNQSYAFTYDIQLLYGTYYLFRTMIYRTRELYPSYVINHPASNATTLHLYFRKVFPPLDNNSTGSSRYSEDENIFFWKADVPNFTRYGYGTYMSETQIALSPFILVDKNKLKVQLRLFYKRTKCYLEVRYLGLSVDGAGRLYPMKLTVVHPIGLTGRVTWPFELLVTNSKRSMVLELMDYSRFFDFFHEKKLLLSLEMPELP